MVYILFKPAPARARLLRIIPNFASSRPLYLLYTLKQGISLNAPITYFWTNADPPDPNVCPLDVPETPANAHNTTIGNALTGMIQSSNNIYTRAFAILWGTGPVEAMAAGLGMSSTFLNQEYVGCGFRGAVRNELTLQDLAVLYRAVDNGSALSGSARQTFLNTLVGSPGAGGAVFSSVVSREASKMGKSSIVPQFLSSLDVHWKGGSYVFWLAAGGMTSKLDYSIAGLAYIPFVNSSGIYKTSYFFGDFVNDLVVSCSITPPCSASDTANNLLFAAVAEALASPIRSALTTWPTSI